MIENLSSDGWIFSINYFSGLYGIHIFTIGTQAILLLTNIVMFVTIPPDEK
jgi:hypothetical protein